MPSSTTRVTVTGAWSGISFLGIAWCARRQPCALSRARFNPNMQAVTDVPHILFAEDLIAAYPDAKVILTTRDPEEWWKSYSSTVALHLRGSIGLERAPAWLEPRELRDKRVFWRLVFRTLFGLKESEWEVTPEIA